MLSPLVHALGNIGNFARYAAFPEQLHDIPNSSCRLDIYSHVVTEILEGKGLGTENLHRPVAVAYPQTEDREVFHVKVGQRPVVHRFHLPLISADNGVIGHVFKPFIG